MDVNPLSGRPTRKETTCSHCKKVGHNKATCPDVPENSKKPKGEKSHDKIKKGAAGASKAVSGAKRKSAAKEDDENVADAEQSDGSDSSSDSGAEDFVVGGNLDGGEGENDEEEDNEIEILVDGAWIKCLVPELYHHETRSVDGAIKEDIRNVLPVFQGRHSGSRVNMTPGVPRISTAMEYFMLFFTNAMLGVFVAASNA